MHRFFSRLLAPLTLGFALAGAAHGANFDTLNPVQPADSDAKVEVLEFFSYSCPHCAKIEPLLESWAQNLPDGVAFRGVPVAFNAGMVDLQKLFFVLEALGRTDLHPKVFTALHDERKQIFSAAAIADWVATQGVDKAAFLDAFNSFGIQTKINRANELAQAYKIDGTPTLAIGGKYITSPAHTGSYQAAVDEADRLVKELLAQ